MNILGVRCSTTDFTFSIITGNQENPTLLCTGTIKFPVGNSDAEKLHWFYQEVGGIIKKHSIGGIGIKGVEPLAMKGKNYGARTQIEGMIYLQAAQCGIKYIKTKVKNTIAKDFGLKGNGKYLASRVDYTKIDGFNEKNQNTQESIQVALSMLN